MRVPCLVVCPGVRPLAHPLAHPLTLVHLVHLLLSLLFDAPVVLNTNNTVRYIIAVCKQLSYVNTK